MKIPLRITVLGILCLLSGLFTAYPQDNDRLVTLSKQIIETKMPQDLYAPFEELKGLYFADNKYAQFVEFLRSPGLKKNTLQPFADYYIALTRYNQLKYLEENQNWEEYFASGNTYRDELVGLAKKTIDTTTTLDKLNIYARLLLWQFHKDQQDSSVDQASGELMNSIIEYSKSVSDGRLIKEVADKFLSYGEKANSKELYKAYAEKLIASPVKDEELKAIAAEFYKEDNLDLAQNFYDLYLERIFKALPKEETIPVLIGLAKDFSYKDQGPNDPVYAEKLFAKIEELGGKQAFDEEIIYLRAFNLEKSKEYVKAKDQYLDLANAFPGSVHAEKALFKAGVIYTYILRDRSEGKKYFQKLIEEKETLSAQGASGLYQLGLLSQWEEDFNAAKGYYDKLCAAAGENFPGIVALARGRLKEIIEAKPIEYNLKAFLDASFKEEYAALDMAKIDLKSEPLKVKKDETVSVNSGVFTGSTGCMQADLEYLWSGQLGSTPPSQSEPSFNTSYASQGTEMINLVVISPSGIIDRSIVFVDVD